MLLENTGRINQSRTALRKKMPEAEFNKILAKQRERDTELVTGVFKNLENPGGALEFTFKKYKQDTNDTYWLRDGERYTIPRMVAVHLNQNCFYKEYKHHSGFKGQEGMRAARKVGHYRSEDMNEMRKVHRYQFANLDFMDDDLDMKQSNLSTVAYKD